jgi:MinD-like ATPase involved in chromosome partitioning or flagellar assembly
MSRGKALAFHSYKGGTGKTTVVTNLAAIYAAQGLRVCVLDFDLYAPGLSTYFRKTSNVYLNSVLRGEETIEKVLLDVSDEIGVSGKLYLGLSSPRKDDINEIEIHHDTKWHLTAIRRFFAAKKTLFDKYQLDYLFLDTSPGIRYWSCNAIVISDILFLLMTINDTNIEGTKQMTTDIYDTLNRFGSQYYLLANKIPNGMASQSFSVSASDIQEWEKELSSSMEIPVIGSIPCFCDIQFSRHEFLFAIKQPDHPFSIKMHDIAATIHEAITHQ